MPDNSLNHVYDALLSTTMVKYKPQLFDNISTSTTLLKKLMGGDRYKRVSDLGERAAFALMYGLGQFSVVSGYSPVNRTPTNGITTGFAQWRTMQTPIMISREEERKNAGSETRILNLLETKVQQAELTIKDGWARALLQGNGPNTATAITTPYTDPVTGDQFIDPLGLIVKKSPATGAVGSLDPATHTWYRNQARDIDAATTYAGVSHELRGLNNDCTKGPGGPPNLHVLDQNTFEFYEGLLAAKHQNPSYTQGDLPFKNPLVFKGMPVIFDEFMYNAEDESTTLDADEGSWLMLNTEFLELQVDAETDFVTTSFKEAQGQLARAADILWMGALFATNRRKHGIGYSINTDIVS